MQLNIRTHTHTISVLTYKLKIIVFLSHVYPVAIVHEAGAFSMHYYIILYYIILYYIIILHYIIHLDGELAVQMPLPHIGNACMCERVSHLPCTG